MITIILVQLLGNVATVTISSKDEIDDQFENGHLERKNFLAMNINFYCNTCMHPPPKPIV